MPRVSPTPASRAVFFAAVCPAHVCLLAAAGSRGCRANTPRRAEWPGGLRVPPGALPAAKGTLPVRWPLLGRAAQPSYPAGAGVGALATFGAQARCLPGLAHAALPEVQEGHRDPGGQVLGEGLGWGWVVCVGMGQRQGRCLSIAALSVRMGQFLPGRSLGQAAGLWWPIPCHFTSAWHRRTRTFTRDTCQGARQGCLGNYLLLPLWLLGRGTWDPVWVYSCWFYLPCAGRGAPGQSEPITWHPCARCWSFAEP